ncbi:hypothetical protein LF1_19790 [Rubripirellula obstinata]|uniref:Transposase DDE domain-containing protein n=1 Tax=Rubripirellula obstinata TaxID=406547 RepID=A0A5B1CE77_9BACT|nr:IS1380 family transposase [Rubripirellula obstinata]KAA1259447.1 hypothetical protein LF1_19790 [Rubripirellula obstinata]
MTQRKPKEPTLKRLRRKAVDADFTGGTITTDAGLLLLREVDRKLNLINRVAQVIPDPRDPIYTTHTQAEILTSRVFGIAAGYEDANDHQQLRDDPAFHVAAQRSLDQSPGDDDYIPLASPSTISRLENRIDKRTCFELHEILVQTFLDSYDEAPDEIVLDIDSTDDPVHGEQEKRFFNGYYDRYCFLPLYVFCGDQLLVSYLRSSGDGGAKHVRPIIKLLVGAIRQRFPDVKIIVRGDTDFSKPNLMRWCERNDVGYVLGFGVNSRIKQDMVYESIASHCEYKRTGKTARHFRWIKYRAKRWKTTRWIVGKSEHGNKGRNQRFVVTNLPELFCGPAATATQACSPCLDPEKFYAERYCIRGEMENRIKEQQLFLFSDRTSCSKFVANQFRLLLSSFAYVLVDGLRRIGLSGTGASRWRVDTIRLRLLKISARVVSSVRRVMFHLSETYAYRPVYHAVLGRLCGSD